MGAHIKNIIKIINYSAEKIYELDEKNIFKKVYENIHEIIKQKALYCEISNLICFYEIENLQKNTTLDECIEKLFKHRDVFYELIIKSEIEKLKKDYGIKNLKNIVEEKKKMNIDTLKEYCFISLFLNWLQGPLKNKISNKLKDFIGYATTLINYLNQSTLYLDYVTKIDIENFIEEKDFELLKEWKDALLVNLYEAVKKLKEEDKNTKSIFEEFLFIHKSLKKLESEVGSDMEKLLEYFSEKIIVSVSLIYLTNYPIEIKISEINDFNRMVKNFIVRYSRYSDKEISKK